MQPVCGIHAVEALLDTAASEVVDLCLYSGRHDPRREQLAETARRVGVPVRRVTADTLDQLSDGLRHQGVIARATARPPRPEAWLLECCQQPGRLLLALDRVEDPHNLGACLRSADAAGVDAVIVPRAHAASVGSIVRRVACGAAETMPLVEVGNLARVLQKLQAAGAWVVGLDAAAEQSLYDLELSTGSLVLVLGSEGLGLRQLTRQRCDYLASLPMTGSVGSLNVSVAAGIALFEARRQRTVGAKGGASS